jgi:predicted nucleic acid-binding Zn ribbon protein
VLEWLTQRKRERGSPASPYRNTPRAAGGKAKIGGIHWPSWKQEYEHIPFIGGCEENIRVYLEYF